MEAVLLSPGQTEKINIMVNSIHEIPIATRQRIFEALKPSEIPGLRVIDSKPLPDDTTAYVMLTQSGSIWVRISQK